MSAKRISKEIKTTMIKKGTLPERLKKNRTLLLMLLPALILVITFNYIPMAGIVIAFKNYNYGLGIWKSEWVGFSNFNYLWLSGKLLSLTVNTLLYNIAFIVVGFVAQISLAVFLSEINNKIFKKITQTFMFLPQFISWVIVAVMMVNIFGENGVLRNIMNSMGYHGFWNIYEKVDQWPIVMVMINMWKSAGYGSVVYLAAIIGISPELYEAAKIDGASIWQRTFKITLPCIKATIIIMMLLAVGNIFRGDFGMFYQIVRNNQLLLQTSDILDTYVYRALMTSSNLGMSAAASFFQSILCFITINVCNFIVKKIEPEYVLF